MKRVLVQAIFGFSFVAWLIFFILSAFFYTFGDCGDVACCRELKSALGELAFWRWLAGAMVLFLVYRLVRIEAER